MELKCAESVQKVNVCVLLPLVTQQLEDDGSPGRVRERAGEIEI